MTISVIPFPEEPGTCFFRLRAIRTTSRKRNPTLILIPGNPGLVDYYKTFLKTLSHNFSQWDIWCVSHAGFSTAKGSDREPYSFYSLDEQVYHKVRIVLKIILEQYTPNNPVPLYFLSHSVGSWVVQRVIKELVHDSSLAGKFSIEFSGMICPTISSISESKSGVICKFLCNWLPISFLAAMMATVLRFVLPALVERALIGRILGQKPKVKDEKYTEITHAVDATHELYSRNGIIKQALELSKEEMARIDGDQEVNDWYFCELSKTCKCWVFFAQADCWVHDKTRELIIRRYRDNANVAFDVDSTDAGIEHSFCVGQSSVFAQITIDAIKRLCGI